MTFRTLLCAATLSLLGLTLLACDSGDSDGDGGSAEPVAAVALGFCDQFTVTCGSWMDTTAACADWWAAAAPGVATDITGANQGCYDHHLNLAVASAGNPMALAGYCANATGRADSTGNNPCVDAPPAPVCAEPAPCTAGSKDCDGNVSWECQYDADSCPAKVTLEDCAAKNQICGAGGLCAPDPAGQPTGIICSEFDQCLLDACPTQEQTCVQNAFTATCSPQAETPTETNLYLALNQCAGSFCADATTQSQLIECFRTNCLTEFATCQAGTFGVGECGPIEACLNATGCVGPTGAVDAVCSRGCLSQASAAANETYWDVQLCVLAACDGSPDPGTCVNQALQAVCADPMSQCQGNTG